MGFGSGLPKFVPSLSWQCSPQINRLLATVDPAAVVLDLGAGGRRASAQVKTVDWVDTGDTDYVCDVCAVPITDESVDMIIATGIIEHVEDDAALLREMRRLVKDGGIVHVEAPFLQQHHDDPIDCRRFTVDGLVRRLDQFGFTSVAAGFHMGPSVTIATLLSYYISLLFEGEGRVRRALAAGAFVAASTILWPMRYLDAMLKSRKNAHRLAFGVYCTARKRAVPAITGAVL